MKQLLLITLFLSYNIPNVNAQFAGGDGSEGDPFQVETLKQLQDIGNHLDDHFLLISDIDATASDTMNNELGFMPIGNNTHKFSGTFDGNDFKITNLYINRPDENRVGLFGEVEGGVINKVILDSVQVTGKAFAAALVSYNGGKICNSSVSGVVSGYDAGGVIGFNLQDGELCDSQSSAIVNGMRFGGGAIAANSGMVKNVFASGKVSASFSTLPSGAGGLVGINYAVIDSTHATGTVESANAPAGGLVGYNRGEIIHSYAEGDVTGDKRTGGLIGLNVGTLSGSYASGWVNGKFKAGGLIGENEGDVSRSFAKGNVNAEDSNVGGLIGINVTGVVNQSHASGDITGGNKVGGLIGLNEADGSVEKSYASGIVSGEDEVGGLVGFNSGNINTSYSIAHVSAQNVVGGLTGENRGSIDYSFASGDITGNDFIGGLVGINSSNGRISGSYSAGKVSGNLDVGGFTGVNGAELGENYWDFQASMQSNAVGRGEKGNVTGLETSQMTGETAAEYMSAFLFDEIWTTIMEDYPRLLWSVGVFSLSDITTNSPVTEGKTLEVEVTITNTGEVADHQNIVLRRKTGEIVDSLDSLFLNTGQEAQVSLNWQTEVGDAGDYEFVVQSETSSLLFEFQVSIFGGGKGSKEDPYQIANLRQLQEIRLYTTDHHFIQISDIQAAETEAWNEGAGFMPLGDNLTKFNGSYDGNGYKIDSLHINRQELNNVGLFGFVEKGTIKNVTLSNVYIRGSLNVGALVGRFRGDDPGFVKNSGASGEVSGSSRVGGLIGYNFNTVTISDSYAEVNIEASSTGGGLTGENRGDIFNSYSTGNILIGYDSGGGLTGSNRGRIHNSYATGNVNGDNAGDIGGLVGTNSNEIKYSFATGDVIGRGYAGGLAGSNGGANNLGRVEESYATGKVSGDDYTGGLIGFNASWASLVSSYWNTETSMQSNAVGGGNSSGATGLITEQMTGSAAEEFMDSFSFNDYWKLNPDGYPLHPWKFVRPVSLLLPEDGKVGENLDFPEFSWQRQDSAALYGFQLSTDSLFSEFIIDSTGIADSVFILTTELSEHTLYFWRIRGINNDGVEGAWSHIRSYMTPLSELTYDPSLLPREIILNQNYPNPFNPSTIIRFGLPEQSKIQLEVYNNIGQRVARLINETKNPGWHEVAFDASTLSSGVYLIRLTTPGGFLTRQMTVIK